MSEKYYLWSSEDAQAVLKEQIRQRNYCLRRKRLAKTAERKAYWHGQAQGLRNAVGVARWLLDEAKERERKEQGL